jgi:two-component system sensor kinase FixL
MSVARRTDRAESGSNLSGILPVPPRDPDSTDVQGRHAPVQNLRAPRAVLGWSAAVFLAYVAFDWLTFSWGIGRNGTVPWNPSSAVAVAALASLGFRLVPAVFVAALASEILVHLRGGAPLAVFALATISTLFAVGCAALLRRNEGRPCRLATVTDTLAFVAVVFGGAAIYTVTYVPLASAFGIVDAGAIVPAMTTMVLNESVGLLVLTPVLLLMGQVLRSEGPAALRPTLEGVAMALAIIVTLAILFLVSLSIPRRLFYLLFLPLIWIALRKGVRGASLAVLFVQAGLVGTETMLGVAAPTLLNLQLFLLVLALTSLLLGAVATENREGEAARRAREDELQTIFSTAPDALLVLDLEGRVRSANPAAERLFGCAARDLVARPFHALVPGLDVERTAARAFEGEARTVDGRSVPVELSLGRGAGPSAPYVAVVRDLTSRRDMEARLARKQDELERTLRLAAVSEMASALAHELNQPLSAASNYVRACSRMVSDPAAPPDPRLHQTIQRATAEMTRAADIVRRLRDFFRTGAGQLEPVRVDALVAEALRPLRERLTAAGVTLTQRHVTPSPLVFVDPLHVDAVIQNLVVNAMQAMAESSDARRVVVRSIRDGDDRVRIVVSDSGPGIDANVRAALFDPFSTTKADGLGLGLALSRALIEGQGGTLQLDESGSDTTFEITLPIHTQEESHVSA